ncbi:unnamed protein product [Ectocarpus fasciculatus]
MRRPCYFVSFVSTTGSSAKTTQRHLQWLPRCLPRREQRMAPSRRRPRMSPHSARGSAASAEEPDDAAIAAAAAAAAVFRQLDAGLDSDEDDDAMAFGVKDPYSSAASTPPSGDRETHAASAPVATVAAPADQGSKHRRRITARAGSSVTQHTTSAGGRASTKGPGQGTGPRERGGSGVVGVGRGKGGGGGRVGRGGRGISSGRSNSGGESRALVEKVKGIAASGSWEEALAHVAEARSSGLKLDGRVHTAAIHAALVGGKARPVLATIAGMRADGFVPNISLYNKAISLCGRQGAWEDAVFLLRDAQRVSSPGQRRGVDVVTFSAAVAACRDGGEWRQALALMEEMQAAGIKPDQIAYGTAVSACAMAGQWQKAVALLADMRRSKLRPDVVAYSSAIKACGGEGRWEEALGLLKEMQESGVRPNLITYTGAMEACGRAGRWNNALGLLAEVRDRGLRPDTFTLNAVMDALGRSGETEKALALLETMRPPRPRARPSSATPPGFLPSSAPPSAYDSGGVHSAATLSAGGVKSSNSIGRLKNGGGGVSGGEGGRGGGGGGGPRADVFTWSAAMTACIEGGQWQKVAGMLEEMRGDGVPPNVINYNLAIRALGQGGDWERATGLLEEMKEAGVSPDDRTFNAAIEACGRGGCWERAVRLVDDMHTQGLVPDSLTYSIVIAACDRSGAWDVALMMLDDAREEDEAEKGGNARGGGGVKTKGKANVFSYTAAVSACGKAGRWEEAVGLLDLMRQDGVSPNEITLRTVLIALENAPPPIETRGQSAPVPSPPPAPSNRPPPTAQSSAVETPSGEETRGRVGSTPPVPWKVAVSLLESMARGEVEGEEGRRVAPAPRDFSAGLMAACFGGAEWSSMVQILDLMHACAAGAQPACNPRGFHGAPEGSRVSGGGDADWGPDGGSSSGLVQAYNHVIRACGAAGGTEFVLALLQEMHRRGVPPDAASYSGAIIACDLAGMWREAVGLLDDMREKTGIEPDLVCYNCAVKACGSSGEFEQALSVVETMRERGVAPDESTYSNAITACGNAGEAKRAIGLLQAMKDDGVPAGLVAHNAAIGACDKAGECSLVLSVLKDMRSAGIRPDAISYAGAISSCDKAGEWRLTLGLYDQMVADMAADASASSINSEVETPGRRSGESGVSSRTESVRKGPRVLLPPPRATVAALTACARGGQWEKAVGILRDVQNNSGGGGVDRGGSGDRSSGGGGSEVWTYFGQASSLAFNAALVACAKGAEMEAAEGREGGWREALEVLDMVGPCPDLTGYGLAITACGFANNVDACVGLLGEMLRRDMTPTLADYHGSLRACAARRRDDAAQEILDSMASEGVEPDARCYRFASEAFGKSADDENDASPEAEHFSKIAERLELEAARKVPSRRGGDSDEAGIGGLGEALVDMGMSGTAGLQELLAKAEDAEIMSVGCDEETT